MNGSIVERVLAPGLSLVNIPDDKSVEARYPKVTWAGHPRLRRAQRKCFLMAEHYRAHPEAEAEIIARNRAFDARTKGFTEGGLALQKYAGERLAGNQPPLEWDGIEATRPHVAGPKLTRGDRRGGDYAARD